MLQMLEPRIDSSLLQTKADGIQDFVHDTIRDYFASRAALSKLRTGALDFVGLHNILGFKGGCRVESEYRKAYLFLREMFGDDYNPEGLNRLLADNELFNMVTVGDHYGLGDNSKLLIRIKDNAYCDLEGQMSIAKIVEYLHLTYGVSLICLEGSSAELDTSFYDSFETSDSKRKVAELFVKFGLLTGVEFLDITTDYSITYIGCEDRQQYVEEHGLKTKNSEQKTNEEMRRENSIHLQRQSVLVANAVDLMKSYNQDVAILLYGGGYSYDIDLSPLIKEGISYVLLNPKVGKINWELHKKRLNGELPPLKEIIMDFFSNRE